MKQKQRVPYPYKSYRLPYNYPRYEQKHTVKHHKKPHFRRFGNKFVSIVQKIVWISAMVVSGALCVVQFVNFFDKFLGVPTATYVRVENFKQNTFPGITMCHSTFDHAYEFAVQFLKRCEKSPICRHLSDYEKQRISFKKMNLTLTDLWNLNIRMTVEVKNRCFYAVDFKECNSTDWMKMDKTDTIVGPCHTFKTDVLWYYVGKPWVYWIEITNIEELTIIPFMFDFYTTKTVNILFVSKSFIHRYAFNQVSILSTTFEYLDTSQNPCSTEEEQVRCINRRSIERLETLDATCRWPFVVNSSLPLCDSMLDVTKVAARIKEIQYSYENGCNRPCSITSYSLEEDKGKNQLTHNTTFIALTLQTNNRQIVSEYYSYTNSSFISDLGGSLGLFLGISVLSCLRVLIKLFDHLFK